MNQLGLDEKYIINLFKEQLSFFDNPENISISEIGDGNINYVYRVSLGEKSVIVKFADDHVRTSKRNLSSRRNKIEKEILQIQEDLTDGMVPHIMYYSEEDHCIVMEDLKDYDVLRESLHKREEYPFFAKSIAKFLYDTLIKTSDLVLSSEEKKNAVIQFINYDMCEISERLVFTEPYLNQQKVNSYCKSNHDFILKEIYEDYDLHFCVANLKNKFMNDPQSLLHGDLHSGSIFINKNSIKVFDPEFSFYGPIGYDIGNILASFLISYIIELYENNRKETNFTEWLKSVITDVVEEFIYLYQKNYDEDVKTPMFKESTLFKDHYLEDIIQDTAGYMGTEIIRRTIGAAKAWDLVKVKDTELLAQIERKLLKIGKDAIMNCDKCIDSKGFKDIINYHLN